MLSRDADLLTSSRARWVHHVELHCNSDTFEIYSSYYSMYIDCTRALCCSKVTVAVLVGRSREPLSLSRMGASHSLIQKRGSQLCCGKNAIISHVWNFVVYTLCIDIVVLIMFHVFYHLFHQHYWLEVAQRLGACRQVQGVLGLVRNQPDTRESEHRDVVSTGKNVQLDQLVTLAELSRRPKFTVCREGAELLLRS
jgi:hypothetical protein